MKFTIDRFEGNHAIAELSDNEFANIPKVALPSNAKEGDVITVEIDVAETNIKREEMKKLMNDVWDNDNTLGKSK